MEVKLWAGEPHQGASFVASLEEEQPAHWMEELHVAALDSESHKNYGEGDCGSQSEATQSPLQRPRRASPGCISHQAPVGTALLPFTWHSPDMGATSGVPGAKC